MVAHVRLLIKVAARPFLFRSPRRTCAGGATRPPPPSLATAATAAAAAAAAAAVQAGLAPPWGGVVIHSYKGRRPTIHRNGRPPNHRKAAGDTGRVWGEGPAGDLPQLGFCRCRSDHSRSFTGTEWGRLGLAVPCCVRSGPGAFSSFTVGEKITAERVCLIFS